MTRSLIVAVSIILSITVAGQLQATGKSKKKATGSSKNVANKKKPLDKGRLLIGVYECLACHCLRGEGNKEGVALDHLNRSRSFLIEHILDPETHVEKNQKAFSNEPNVMPSYQLGRKEAADIADYLISLKTPSAKNRNAGR